MRLCLVMQNGPALATRIGAGYQGVATMTASGYAALDGFLRADLTDVVVLDDRMGSPAALMQAVDAGIAHQKLVLVHLVGPALSDRDRYLDRGVAVTPGLDEDALLLWIVAQVQLQATSATNVRIVATASAKGGASKTTLLALAAEALAYRGLRVLCVDTDLSNAALRAYYGFGADARPYTELAQPDDHRGWSVATVTSYISTKLVHIRGRDVHISFLLGASTAADFHDVNDHDVDGLFSVLQQLPFDIILVDTGPELLRRPMIVPVFRAGGRVLVPCPTGVLEREGANNLLTTIKQWDQAALERTALVFVEPERGSVTQSYLPTLQTTAKRNYPSVGQLGLLPRDAHAISSAVQFQATHGRYHSPLHVSPYSRLAQGVWALSDAIATFVDITLPEPAPKRGFIDRLFRRNRMVMLPPVADGITVPEGSMA